MSYPNGNKVAFANWLSPPSDYTLLVGSTELSLNKWYHVIAIVNSNKLTLYVNGESDGTFTLTNSILQPWQMIIGASLSGTPQYFNGEIDEVRIYNRALSAEEVKASYEAGQITITSTISGAEVLLDGISRGKATPSLILDGISPGSHTVKCRLSGYADSETTVNLAASSTASVTCSLSQAPGSISVTSSPSGAEVYLDGALKGTAPVMLKDVSPGKHVIWCKKSGFEDFQLNIEVASGGVTTSACNLTPAPPGTTVQPGTALPQSTPIPTSAPPPKSASITGRIIDVRTGEPVQGVAINIDGKIATTGANGEYELTVDAGKHSLSASKSGYEPLTRSVIVQDEGTMLDLSLKSSSGESSWFWIVAILIIVGIAIGIIYLIYRKKKQKPGEEKKIVAGKEEKQKFCMYCHAPLTADSQFCNKCGKKQEEKPRFCMNCGAPMPLAPDLCPRCSKMPPSDVDTKNCPNCNEVIPKVAKFCSNCGARQPE